MSAREKKVGDRCQKENKRNIQVKVYELSYEGQVYYGPILSHLIHTVNDKIEDAAERLHPSSISELINGKRVRKHSKGARARVILSDYVPPANAVFIP